MHDAYRVCSNFAAKDKIDFISMGYNVKRYYEEPSPVVTIHLNESVTESSASIISAITPTLWDNEGMVYLLDPSHDKQKVTCPSSASLIEVANYAITIEVYPKCSPISIQPGEGLKVIFGSISIMNDGTEETRQPFDVANFTSATTTADSTTAIADKGKAAIILRMTSVSKISGPSTWATAADIPVRTKLFVSHLGLELAPLQFRKVESLWWDAPFKGVDFYNLSGFHFRFLENKIPITHMQFCTAGKGVICGVHNHSGDMFCEIHLSLSAGTEKGGMSKLKKEFEDTPPAEMNKIKEDTFDHLVLSGRRVRVSMLMFGWHWSSIQIWSGEQSRKLQRRQGWTMTG